MEARSINKWLFVFAAVGVAMVFAALAPFSAYAYYERDPVTITLSSSSVSVDTNGTSNIACKVTPASEKQLPGCGMEGCPQTCGDGCLDKNGWCTCAGLAYETYTTSILVSSSASNIATGSYSNGVLKVKGVSAGTATLTLTGQLSKHLDATAMVKVTVSSKIAAAESSESSSDSGSSSSAKTDRGSAGSASSAKSNTAAAKGSSSGAAAVSSASGKKAAKSSKTGTAVSALNTSVAAVVPKEKASDASAVSAESSSSASSDSSVNTAAAAAASANQASEGLDIGFANGLSLDASSAFAQLDITKNASAAVAGDEVPLPVALLALVGLVALVISRARLKKQEKL